MTTQAIPPGAEIAEWIAALEATCEHLATRADLSEIRGDLQADLESLRGDLRTDIKGLESKISDMETRLMRWFLSITISVFGLVAGLGIAAIVRYGG